MGCGHAGDSHMEACDKMRTPITDKSDSRILYQRIKDVALKFGKSGQYEKWLKSQSPGKSWHHICGSVHGKKSTDYRLSCSRNFISSGILLNPSPNRRGK